MSFGRPGSTRAALLIESITPDGEKRVLIYHLAEPIMLNMEQDYDNFNIFDEATRYIRREPERLTVQAYLADPEPRQWNGPMPESEQQELQPVNLAIESSESDIIVEAEEYEDWEYDEDDIEDHWRDD